MTHHADENTATKTLRMHEVRTESQPPLLHGTGGNAREQTDKRQTLLTVRTSGVHCSTDSERKRRTDLIVVMAPLLVHSSFG